MLCGRRRGVRSRADPFELGLPLDCFEIYCRRGERHHEACLPAPGVIAEVLEPRSIVFTAEVDRHRLFGHLTRSHEGDGDRSHPGDERIVPDTDIDRTKPETGDLLEAHSEKALVGEPLLLGVHAAVGREPSYTLSGGPELFGHRRRCIAEATRLGHEETVAWDAPHERWKDHAAAKLLCSLAADSVRLQSVDTDRTVDSVPLERSERKEGEVCALSRCANFLGSQILAAYFISFSHRIHLDRGDSKTRF